MQHILKIGGAFALMAALASAPAIAQDSADGIFTADQVTAGTAVYEANCAGCHAANLTGTPGGPGIAGARFKAKWAKRTVGEFYTYVHDNMPAGMGGSLTEDEYLAVVSYILSVNKFAPGEEALTADTERLNGITIGVAAAAQ